MAQPPPCFNIHNRMNYCQRSQTLQPIRGGASNDVPITKQYLIEKYFRSQLNAAEHERQQKSTDQEHQLRSIEQVGASYANCSPEPKESPPLGAFGHKQIHSSHSHQQLRLHSRSHSQYHYNMCQINDSNNYYNLSNTFIPTRAVHPSPLMNEPSAQIYNQVTKLDELAIITVCSELGCCDAPPPVPSKRNYVIVGSRENGLYKFMQPSSRSHKRNQDFGLPQVDLDILRKK